MSKKLNGFEALNAPIGTQFEVKYRTGITRKVEVYKDEDGVLLKYIDIKEFDVMDFHKGIDTAEFIPIQQPVSFMEVVKASAEGKKVKYSVDENYGMFRFDNLKSALRTLIFNDSLKVAEIIQGPYWYIEESEADSNDIR